MRLGCCCGSGGVEVDGANGEEDEDGGEALREMTKSRGWGFMGFFWVIEECEFGWMEVECAKFFLEGR